MMIEILKVLSASLARTQTMGRSTSAELRANRHICEAISALEGNAAEYRHLRDCIGMAEPGRTADSWTHCSVSASQIMGWWREVDPVERSGAEMAANAMAARRIEENGHTRIGVLAEIRRCRDGWTVRDLADTLAGFEIGGTE